MKDLILEEDSVHGETKFGVSVAVVAAQQQQQELRHTTSIKTVSMKAELYDSTFSCREIILMDLVEDTQCTNEVT